VELEFRLCHKVGGKAVERWTVELTVQFAVGIEVRRKIEV
jgi:hypothetical protein